MNVRGVGGRAPNYKLRRALMRAFFLALALTLGGLMLSAAATSPLVVDKILLGSGGIDIVKSIVSFTLGTYVENLTLTGTEAIDGTGNGAANAIAGNGAANALDGAAGADTLRGGGGADTLGGAPVMTCSSAARAATLSCSTRR